MRSLKAKVLSACTFGLRVFGAAIHVPSHEREVAQPDGQLLHLGMNDSYILLLLPSVGIY
jgi:hypothetical protein